MPAAASENTLWNVFGRNAANRRCSEWRAVSRSLRRRQERAEGKRRSRVAARKARNGKASKRSRNRQAQGKGPPDRSRPPDGTGRRNGRSGDESRFPWEPPIDDGQPDAMSITMQWHSRCDGTRGVQSSITAAKPEANGSSDRPKLPESQCGDRGAGGNTGPIFVEQRRAAYPATRPTRTSTPLGSLTANS